MRKRQTTTKGDDDGDDDVLPSPKLPPPNPARHAREVDLARMLKPGYWRKLCPQLHVMDAAYQAGVEPMRGGGWGGGGGDEDDDDGDVDVASEARERILRDGYVKIPAEMLRWKSVNHRRLALGVVQLMQHGWHPSFLLMYDEAWAVAHELSDIIQAATVGGRQLCIHAVETQSPSQSTHLCG